MKDQRQFLIATLAIITALLLLQCGCSAVGAGVGSAIDAHKPDSVIMQGYRLSTIKQGSPLTVTLTNGSQITGTFDGGMAASAEWIDTLYMRARLNDPGCAILPALGDTVEFIHRSGLIRGQIKNVVYRRRESDCDFYFGFAPVDSSEEREFCLRHLLAVRGSDGGLLRSGDIANAIAQSHTFVPYSLIEMVTNEGIQLMPLDHIARVAAPSQKHARRNGLIVGAVIDVCMILAFFTGDNTGFGIVF
jgi:hypothetical protein